MSRSVYLLLVCLFIGCALGSSEYCSAEIALNKKSGSGNHQMWGILQFHYYLNIVHLIVIEIVVINTGLCPIETIFAAIETPPGGSIVHKWNYDSTTSEIKAFGPSINTDAISSLTFVLSTLFDCKHVFKGAGFIFAGEVVPSVGDVNPKCSKTCTLYVILLYYACRLLTYL